MAETPISEILRVSLDNVKKAVDANTVVGDPITVMEHTVIVPISKISCGIATGGTDFGGKKPNTKKGFGGGGGTGVTVTPVAFLVIGADGNVKLLNVGENSGFASGKVADALAAFDGIIDKAPSMVDKIADLFVGDDKKEDKDKGKSKDKEKVKSKGKEKVKDSKKEPDLNK